MSERIDAEAMPGAIFVILAVDEAVEGAVECADDVVEGERFTKLQNGPVIVNPKYLWDGTLWVWVLRVEWSENV